MKTKVEAVEICAKKSIEMWIVKSNDENFMVNALNGKSKATKFIF